MQPSPQCVVAFVPMLCLWRLCAYVCCVTVAVVCSIATLWSVEADPEQVSPIVHFATGRKLCQLMNADNASDPQLVTVGDDE